MEKNKDYIFMCKNCNQKVFLSKKNTSELLPELFTLVCSQCHKEGRKEELYIWVLAGEGDSENRWGM